MPLPPSDAEVYARQLFEKGHGYPLWCPEPYGSSPAYRAKGVSVGDVGYVTQDGEFETLFNICAEADDPVNYNGVPLGFERLSIAEERWNVVPFHHEQNSWVMSEKRVGESIGLGAGVTDPVTQLIGTKVDIQYTWRTAEGAILHLPNGAARFKCLPRLFCDYIKRHAQSWDTFINETLQCSLLPGSIYLVTSCDKTDQWMLGSFHQESAGHAVSLNISVLNLAEGRTSFTYHRDQASPLVCRNNANRIETAPGDSTMSPVLGTQCVFIKGFRVTVRKKRMSSKLKVGVDPIEDSPLQELRGRPRGFLSRLSNSASWTITRQGHSSSSTEHLGESSGSDSVLIEEIPPQPLDWHPSVQWNQWLLDKYPNVTVAFTHDEDIPLLNNLRQSLHTIQQIEGATCENDSAFWVFSEDVHPYSVRSEHSSYSERVMTQQRPSANDIRYDRKPDLSPLVGLVPPAQTFTMTMTITPPQSHTISARTLPDLSQLLHDVTNIAKDRNRARPQRDLAKSAISLAIHFDQRDGSQKQTISDVLYLAFLAAVSGDENKVSEIRDSFENFTEDPKTSAQAVHNYISPLMKEFNRAAEKPGPTSHRAEETHLVHEQNLRVQVTVVKGDKAVERPLRDLAKSAIKLVDALDGPGLSEARVLVLQLTWEAIRSKTRADETREVFEALLDNGLEGSHCVNAVHEELVKLQQKTSAVPVQDDSPDRSSGSSKVSSSSSPVHGSSMGIRPEKIGIYASPRSHTERTTSTPDE